MTKLRRVQVAFVGFGEAGAAFAGGWAEAGLRPAGQRAYDIKTDSAATRGALLARYAEHGVDGAATVAEALATAAAVFCLVTADQALAAAQSAAAGLPAGALWLDGNSCAPETKRAAARVIEAAGGRYVDTAVMAPVHPRRHEVPMLLSGPHAEDAAAMIGTLGMRPRVVPGDVGRASSIKMLRSVMIKGMEALTAECFLAARRAGVEQEVLASLEASDPDIGWRDRGAYCLERMMVHGPRRAAEMREVAKTVEALGLPEGMSSASARWQAWIGGLHATPGADDLEARLDAILGAS